MNPKSGKMEKTEVRIYNIMAAFWLELLHLSCHYGPNVKKILVKDKLW